MIPELISQQKRIIIILALIIVILASGFYFYKNYKDPKEREGVEERMFTFRNLDESLLPEVAANFEKQFYEAVDLIRSENTSLGWILAGNQKKAANDYQGAEELYLRGLEKFPQEYTLYNNLADLYFHFIEDYFRAEEHYLKLIELQPGFTQSYTELSILYKYRFKDDGRAVDILKVGLEKNPENKTLKVTLADLYKKIDKIDEAKKIWEELIKLDPLNQAYKKDLENLK